MTRPRGRTRGRTRGWARLLARMFAVDVLACARCDGRLVATAAVLDTEEIAARLHGCTAPAVRRSPHRLANSSCFPDPVTPTASLAASLFRRDWHNRLRRELLVFVRHRRPR